MDPSPPLLALRIGSSCHALETGRDYLLGSGDDCDLRLPDGPAHAARVEVTPAGPTLMAIAGGAGDGQAGAATVLHNGRAVPGAALAIGDQFVLGDTVVTVVVDDGSALMVPIPALRAQATSRRLAAVRVAAAALRHDEHETFQQLMAHELRRAPWFAFSLLLHALLLLLLWLLLPVEQVGGRRLAKATIEIDQPSPGNDNTPNAPEVTAEPAQDEFDDPEPESTADAPPPEPGEGPKVEMPPMNVRLAPRKHSRAGLRGDGGAGLGSVGFQQAVQDLQQTGLEIVFVFDSTGSMSRTIAATKSTIVQMLAVLHFLVPDARVALVTYRDNDRNSEYVVRQAALDDDYWRTTNFVQFISAEGGGDRPEDVHAGLSAAFGQQWSPNARRVVVLAGDAPPHRADYAQLMSEVRSFVKNGRSFVHTLITSPDRAGFDTEEAFRDIAANGRGICEPLDNHNLVLQRVLTLAFGAQFDRDVQEVTRVVERATERVDTASLHLVRQGGEPLKRALQQDDVPLELWNAVVKRPRRDVGTLLLEVLESQRTPPRARHAVAAALQRICELPVPPIDPEHDAPLRRNELERLHRAVQRLPE
ncbi:MAG: vWA domain-containing protein [Planctomycetota bacterium]